MNAVYLNAILLITVLVLGCNSAATTVSDPTTAVLETDIVQQEQDDQEESSDDPKSATKGLLDFASKIIKEQSDSGNETAKKAQDWMTDKFGEASDSGSQIADDAAKWAADAYQSLKDKGLTSADNAKDWLTEDIRNMNALKYKIVKISMDDLDAVEDQLNDLGKLRWDCFHAVEKDGDTILFFKKERRSVLKNIPVKDMLRLVPLMGDGGGE